MSLFFHSFRGRVGALLGAALIATGAFLLYGHAHNSPKSPPVRLTVLQRGAISNAFMPTWLAIGIDEPRGLGFRSACPVQALASSHSGSDLTVFGVIFCQAVGPSHCRVSTSDEYPIKVTLLQAKVVRLEYLDVDNYGQFVAYLRQQGFPTFVRQRILVIVNDGYGQSYIDQAYRSLGCPQDE